MTVNPINGSIGDLLSKLLHQGLAGQTVAAVDAHSVGSAHAVRARAPVGQGSVLLPLDLVQSIEHPVARLQIDGVLLEMRFDVDVRVIAFDRETCIPIRCSSYQYLSSLSAETR